MGNIETEAWILKNINNEKTIFIKKEISFDDISEDEVLVKPLYGCLEGNMVHAVQMDPENVFSLRNEDEIILGNSGTVVVEKVGENVKNFKAGDFCIYFCNGEWDGYGYPKRITAYDKPQSMGVLAKRIKLHSKELIKIPSDSSFSLQQWAAFSLKYITAWSNWNVAFQCWQSQMRGILPEETYVFAWGGGVAFAELSLAKIAGCKCYLMTSKPERRKIIQDAGINVVERKAATESVEKDFLEYVYNQTCGRGVSIFIDNIGQSSYMLTLKSLGRQGVITSSGWKTGGMLPILRPNECQNRHLHVFTHYARYTEGVEAVKYSCEKKWIPPIQEEYLWECLPDIMEKYEQGKIDSYFPVYKINDL
jgi:NADPH:quinone reductase-like Zn-dependent oxidoreductase